MNAETNTIELLPPHERRILEAHVRGVPLSKLDFLEHPINEYERVELKRLIRQRMEGMPLQYLLGTQGFYGREFYINTTVLVPRPETEGLVELALKTLPKNLEERRPVALDFGTGSGCIAVTLALERRDLVVFASEASEDASAVAEENGVRFRVANVEFLRVSETPYLWQYDDLPMLDMIISNPPYLMLQDEIANDVRFHEPEEALFVPSGDPLYFYRFLAELMAVHLRPDGFGIFEVAHQRAELTAKLFRDLGYSTEISKDLAGHDRYLIVKKVPEVANG